jgi:hypothetical protein
MRVRFPSSALTFSCWSAIFFGVRRERVGRVPGARVPHTCHTVVFSCFLLGAFRLVRLLLRGVLYVPDERPEGLRDGLVAAAGGVLVDHRRPDAGVAESRHQLFERRSGGRREGAASVRRGEAAARSACDRGRPALRVPMRNGASRLPEDRAFPGASSCGRPAVCGLIHGVPADEAVRRAYPDLPLSVRTELAEEVQAAQAEPAAVVTWMPGARSVPRGG